MKRKVAQIFSNLDRWRHLPNYQLERRADIFFSIYLRALVEEYTGAELLDIVVPELPIRVGDSGRSFKVDYVLFAKDRETAYFVELKTGSGSRRDEQDAYLREAASAGLEKVLSDLKEIVGRTSSYRKYGHLLHWLAKAEMIALPDGLGDFLYPAVKPGLRACLARTSVVARDVQIRIIYIQPTPSVVVEQQAGAKESCIDFDFISAHLARHDDEFSEMFAAHLKRWRTAAGDTEPDGWK